MRVTIIILILLANFTNAKSQDNHLKMVQAAVGLSHSELKAYLSGLLQGREPGMAPNTTDSIYTIDNGYMHAEFNVNRDSCLMTSIRFKDHNFFNESKELIVGSYPEDEKVKGSYYTVIKNKRLIVFLILNEIETISVVDMKYMLSLSKQKKLIM